jgi:tRNA nucleotidyltransferase (CCA-adding enzyme)
VTKITADKMASDYMKLRHTIKEKEDEIKKLKEIQTKISDKMLELCSEQNVDSLKTQEGTISRRVLSNYWTSDWESFYKFINEHEALHLLEKRIHNSNMKEFLVDNPDVLPQGLQANTKYVISVRKPSKK